MPDPKLVTTTEAAKAIGVGARTLARWASEKEVQPALITPGGHFRWDVEALRQQLQQRR